MRYNVSDIEDQIMATLKADGSLAGVQIQTHAGEISVRTFTEPSLLEGFIALLPFIFVQYQGRVGGESLKGFKPTSDKTVYFHEIRFRLYVGAESLRATQEAQRLSAYPMLAAIYDDLHGKLPYADIVANYPNAKLSGAKITTTGFNPGTPLMEAGGADEKLVVILPHLVVYQTDYILTLMA